MSGKRVLDACTFARAYFSEPRSEKSRALMLTGETFLAPELILLEVANIADRKRRSGEVGLDYAKATLASLRSVVDEFEPDATLADEALVLALNHGFSSYDAAYLVLALRRNAVLVTVDEAFAKRAAKVGLGDHVVAAV